MNCEGPGRIADRPGFAQPPTVLFWRVLSSDFALSSRSGKAIVSQEAVLHLGQINVGLAAGLGLIVLGLTILLIGLLWSAGRRLRNLPDDPTVVRRMIGGGLLLAAIGVGLATLAVVGTRSQG